MSRRNQPRRQKCAERKYTESEVNAMLRKAVEDAARHNVYTTVAACGLTLHRAFGLGQKRVHRALGEMDKLGFEADCFEQIREALRDEVGVDVRKMWEEENENGQSL